MKKYRILALVLSISLTSCGRSSLGPLDTTKGGLTMVERYKVLALNVELRSKKSTMISNQGAQTILEYQLTSGNRVFADAEIEVSKHSPDPSLINIGGGAKTTSFQFSKMEFHIPDFGAKKIKIPTELLSHYRDPEVKSLSAGITQKLDSKSNFLVLSFDGSSGEHGYSASFICYSTGLVLMIPPSEFNEFHWSLKKDRQTKRKLEYYKNQRSKYWPLETKSGTN